MEVAEELCDRGEKVVILEFDSQKDVAKRIFRRDDVRARYSPPIKVTEPDGCVL